MTTTTTPAVRTVKIRLRTSVVTMDRAHQRGEEIFWPLDDACRMVAAGAAEFVVSPPPKSSAK